MLKSIKKPQDNPQPVIINKPIFIDANFELKVLKGFINKEVDYATLHCFTNLTVIFTDIFRPIPEYSEILVNFLHEKQKNSSISIFIQDDSSLVDIANESSLNHTYKLTAGKITYELKS